MQVTSDFSSGAHGRILAAVEKELASPFTTLTDGSTVVWNCESKKFPTAKLTSTQSFTIDMNNVMDGACGVLKLITATASAITLTFDTSFTNKVLNSAATTHVFPAITAKEYFLEFTVVGTIIEWYIYEANAVADPGGSNDDFLQRKSGVWTYRTPTQILADLSLVVDLAIHSNASAALTLTDMASAETLLPSASGHHYVWFDCTRYKSMRITGRVNTLSGSANNPRIYAKYSTSSGGAETIIGAGTIASGEAFPLTTTGIKKTNWIALPAGAQTDVIFSVYHIGGDGAADPVVGNLHLQFKTS